MYSLVMLMALGTAGEVPEYWGCGYGGGWGGGYCGGYGGYCGGYGGYCGGYSGYCGGYSGYCGGYGGYCYTPCYTTCYAPVYYSCQPMMIVPMTPKKDDKKKPEEVSTQATIVVDLPADAQLTFDGEKTKSTSSHRTFVTPELKPGTEYSYVLKAEVMKDGKPVMLAEKKIFVRAGETTQVTLEQQAAGVASRD
jgi:uncharacterized protein (TIGR03000 family)